MIYATYDKKNLKVNYIGKTEPVAYTENLMLVNSETFSIPEIALKTPVGKLRVCEDTLSIVPA